MESIHFKQSTEDPCVFIQTKERGVTIVAVYVDDLIIITKTAEQMEEVKRNLTARFKMKDLGKLHYCLGITFEQDEKQESMLTSKAIYSGNT